MPGTEQGIRDYEEARRTAAAIGYPVLLKAAAGGGGKGMRRVDGESQLESAMRGASSEAERAFGSGEVYLEKLVERPRHIEIQVLGDEHGHLIHLGERECSIQRRHQKVVEESPSPLVLKHPELRERIGEAAVRIARAANYTNAGTLEFLADQQGNFYFLEMNTRLQVEHPVTEWVTGLDLVRWQIRIAAGERLTLDAERHPMARLGFGVPRICGRSAEQFLPESGNYRAIRGTGGTGRACRRRSLCGLDCAHRVRSIAREADGVGRFARIGYRSYAASCRGVSRLGNNNQPGTIRSFAGRPKLSGR